MATENERDMYTVWFQKSTPNRITGKEDSQLDIDPIYTLMSKNTREIDAQWLKNVRNFPSKSEHKLPIFSTGG